MANDSEARRSRRGRLTRDRVLTAALGLVDREGLSALSMRRLAAELGVEAMALYRYAPGKDALLDGLVEALFLELRDTLNGEITDGAAWREQVHRMARETYRVSLRHPHVVPLIATRMLAVPLARRPPAVLWEHERTLEWLEQAGLDEADAVTAHRAISSWVLGYVFVELRAMVDNPDEPDPAFRLGLHRMSAQELPRLRKAAPLLAVHAGETALTEGLDALLGRFVPERPGAP
jgi:AcrR family transcriptional regulator